MTQRLVLHVGMPKSGSSYLQSVLAGNRDALREQGTTYPWIRHEGMFHAAVEMAGRPERWGLDPAAIEGSFDHLLRRGRRLGGDVLISHEVFSAAGPEQVAEVLRRAEGYDVEVVVTARDLGRTVPAEWQERIKNGGTRSFQAFLDEVVLPPLQGEQGEDEGRFLPAQDLGRTLAVWGDAVGGDRVHLVTAPRAGAPRDLLWRRFAAAVGADPDGVDLGVVAFSNDSLGTAQIAFLRQVISELGDDLPPPWRHRVLKRWFAQTVLAATPGEKAVLPAAAHAPLDALARRWVEQARAAGHVVHGDLDELLPEPPPAGARHPDDVTPDEVLAPLPRATAQALLRVRDLTVRVADLEQQVADLQRAEAEREAAARAAAEAAYARSWRGRAARLRRRGDG